MPSRSYQRWINVSQRALDEVEAAHAAIGGSGPGRRYATQQINQAYTVLLSAHFQQFCRDLHTESADILTASISNTELKTIFRKQLTRNRTLDKGNPSAGNLGSDFGQLGMDLWGALYAQDKNNLPGIGSLRN